MNAQHTRALAGWLLARPRRQTLALVVLSVVGVSCVLSALLRLAFGHAENLWVDVPVAGLVSLAVTWPAMHVILGLIDEIAQAHVHADQLTGLASRRRFAETAHRELARCAHDRQRGASLLLIDLDDFRVVNLAAGHEAGDAVLQQVAQVCAQAVRPGDLLARWGEEEFVALLPGADAATALAVAERLRTAIANAPILHPAVPLRVTVSIGAATTPPHAPQLDRLLKIADAAMLAAKRKGKNNSVAG